MSCNVIREALALCLLRTDCVLRDGRSPAECLKDDTALPEEALHLRKALYECKRGQLDMRKRFRGIDPSQTKQAAADRGEVDTR